MATKAVSDHINEQPLTNSSSVSNGSLKNESIDVEQAGSPLADKKAITDQNLVDFNGDDDPYNPINWSTTRKCISIGIVALLTLLSALTSTTISTGTYAVMEEFHSSDDIIASFITSVYLIGYASGPILIAPLSELYGRLILYQVCSILFLIFNIACAVAPNIGGLIAFRLLAGICGSCPLTIGAGSIADMIALEKRGLAMSLWISGPLLGPSIGPMISGYLTVAKGWRWDFWLVVIVSGLPCILTFVVLKESYPYILLKRKAENLRKETNNPNLRSKLDTGRTPRQLFAFSIIRPLKMLALSPIVLVLSLYAATIYSYLYLCFTTFPRVFMGQYGFSIESSGLVYLGIGVGSIIGLFACGIMSDRLVKSLGKKNGGPQPEHRLPILFIGALIVPSGLFLYGWTAEYSVQWIVPIIGTALLGGGMVIAYMASSSYLVDAYTVHAASAIAASTIVRSLLGALLPLAGNSMFDVLGVGWGNSVLAFIAVGFIPAPFLLYKYGAAIRNSKIGQVEF